MSLSNFFKRVFSKKETVTTKFGTGKIITRFEPNLKANDYSEINSHMDMLFELESGQRIFINEGDILKTENK